MQSEVLSLFCIGKSTGDISEFVLRDHPEITVKISAKIGPTRWGLADYKVVWQD